MATAHHRFAWIHPFGNGNGRVVRLLTYALLIKYGYNVREGGRVLNPTAVFCNDRDRYDEMLALADLGHDEALEAWCIYVLQGILDELRKVDRLADYGYLQEKILAPALAMSRERGLVTTDEHIVLLTGLAPSMPALTDAQRTYQLRKLVGRNMLQPIHEGARQDSLSFASSYLLRGVVKALGEQGFIPPSLN